MSTMLFTWELGGGMSHVASIGPLARHFAAKGHRVAVALRDVSRAPLVFDHNKVEIYQAPTKVRISDQRFDSPLTFAHVLHNIGFGDRDELTSMVNAWRNLYRVLKPDVIVFDHSPTALVAAGTISAKRILLGPGFFAPPKRQPMPRVRPVSSLDADLPGTAESHVLANVNAVRAAVDLKPLAILAELYSDVDETILTTFQELDPYEREDQRYWGIGPHLAAAAPQWPEGQGPRVFAYLKQFPGLGALLEHLRDGPATVLVCADGIDTQVRQQFGSNTLRFSPGPVDLNAVSRDCDIAVLNGTHVTTAAMLLAGKPILQIPITGEQFLTADRTVSHGFGLIAPPFESRIMTAQLDRLMSTTDFSQAARRFAARYDGFDHREQLQCIARKIEDVGALGACA